MAQLKNEVTNMKDASHVNDMVESVALIRSKFAEFAVKKMSLEQHFTAKAEAVDVEGGGATLKATSTT